MDTPQRSVGEVEGFIDLLRAACEDATMNQTLRKLLQQPPAARRRMVVWLVDDMRQRRAPLPLIEAMACLADDEVADKALSVVDTCAR